MSEWVDAAMANTDMSGIPATHWLDFFVLFSEGKTTEQISGELSLQVPRFLE